MNKNKIREALPTVLFVTGIAGIFVSEAMCARDTLKAREVLYKKNIRIEGEPIPYCDDRVTCTLVADKPSYYKAVVKASWKCYIPTAVATTATLACLIASNRLTKKQIALLSSAVASGGALVNCYRKEILDRTNPEILNEIDQAVAEATMKDAKPVTVNTSGIIHGESFDCYNDEEIVIFDPFTRQKFKTTKLAANSARYFLNRNFALGGTVGLEMFYGFLGMDLPEEYRGMEWDIDKIINEGDELPWIDIEFIRKDKPDAETGLPCYFIEYNYAPGELDDGPYEYPFGNPMESDGNIVTA